MFHRNLLGVPDPPLFPTTLVTESGTTCADPRSGSWFDRMAEQRFLLGFEPKDLIEISSEHTPIKFPSRKNSFSTDIDNVPTIVAASDITDTFEAGQLTSPLFTQEREVSANPFGVSVFWQAAASSSQQQPASSSLANFWQTSDVGSFGKLKRGDESSSHVERSLLRGKRDREFGSVSLSQHEKKRILSERKIFTNTLRRKQNELFKVNAQLRQHYLRLRWKWTDKLGKGNF